jgi:glutamyl-tRNA reductase
VLLENGWIAHPPASADILESTLLVTCNRIELYVATDDAERCTESILSGMRKAEGRKEDLYVKKNIDAIGHIFAVASGLDSLVVGEEQIIQQIREAGSKARVSGNARSILSSLFGSAFKVGRRVRTSYAMTPSNKSVSAFALQFALEKLGRRPRKTLLIGTGKTARLAAAQLRETKIYLASRHKRDARERFPDATIVPYAQLRRIAGECDLIISATRNAGYVIKNGDLQVERKIVLLDLAFPRNIDPAIKTSSFIELYDLDDLAIDARSIPQKTTFAASERMISDEAERFARRLVASRLSPTLGNIYRWAEDIRSSETRIALGKLPNLSEREGKVVEAMSRSLVGKLLAPHATFLKQSGGEIAQVAKLRLLESVFGPEATRWSEEIEDGH